MCNGRSRAPPLQIKMTIKLVTMVHPCTACVIIDGLIKEIFAKLKAEYPDVEFITLRLDHPDKLKTVPGLEVEKLPAILVDGEQITAGSLPRRKELAEIIKER